MKTWITVLCAVALLAGCAKKKDGLYTTWYENGQKRDESTWKDGKLVSATVWKPNGEKCPAAKSIVLAACLNNLLTPLSFP